MNNMRKDKDKILIGIFDMDSGQIIDESSIILDEDNNGSYLGGFKAKEGKNKKGPEIGYVYIYFADEGTLPHVHIKRPDNHNNKGRKRVNTHDVCIMLNENAYFVHGNNDGVFEDVKQRDAFEAFMKNKCIENGIETNWEYACRMWNLHYPKNKFDPPATMPKYSTVSKSIHEATSYIKDFR